MDHGKGWKRIPAAGGSVSRSTEHARGYKSWRTWLEYILWVQ
jgi:hypothetical protein